MAELNTAARNVLVLAAANMVSTGTLTILAGATPLAVHTLVGFGTEANGEILANPVEDEQILATGVPNSAIISQTGRTMILSVGIPGSNAEVIIDDDGTGEMPEYIENGISRIASITLIYPAS